MNTMKGFWNDRYSKEGFTYGEAPNVFFKQELDKLNSEKILLPADGEGRNSVYASKNNWEVFACDLSEQGKAKTNEFAKKQNVLINYKVGDFGKLEYQNEYFDAIALIYAHFPPNKKSEYHKLVNNYLKVGGTIIFEAFGKNHLKYNSINPKAGGPKDLDMLFSVDELKSDFPNYKISILEEIEVNLSEGQFHIGKGSVVRFVARKTR
ncbi:MAG: class I SAM-dependent methyltransferase [Flavobacteriaceae bacterium]